MTTRTGFTLVELSIVLVIIGLLTGGVLTGQSLIRAAELRSVTTQYGRYMTAVQTFRDKYFALPGDMTNATKYWGVAAAGAACISTASTTTATCDGDGNGKIDASAASTEEFRFWQHLANAGLIEGSYDGVTHGSTSGSSTVANSPTGRITSSMWWANNFNASGAPDMFDNDLGNHLEFGGVRANMDPATPILKPEEAYNIDTKLDDGKPATGKVVMRAINGLATCSDSSVSSNRAANYLLSGTALSCTLLFIQQF